MIHHRVRRTIWVVLHPNYCKTSTVPLQKWKSMILSTKCATRCKWDRILLAYLSFSALWGRRSPKEPPFVPSSPSSFPHVTATRGNFSSAQQWEMSRLTRPPSIMGIYGYPPNAAPPGNKALIRPYQGIMVVNNPLIMPYFLGGGHWGGTLRFAWINMYQVLQ